MKQKVLLLFSGGFDSVVLLKDLIKQGYEVTPLFFDYGQKNLLMEKNHANYWFNKFNLSEITLRVPMPMGKDEYVYLRNLVLYSYASSIAESKGINFIASALIWGSDFADTKPQFAKGFDNLIFQTAGIELLAPYVWMNKLELSDFAVDSGFDLVEILSHSITCNVPVNGDPCGECGGCKEISEIIEKHLK